jgi:hypothetical protein
LVVLLTATVFMRYIDLWSAAPILVEASSMTMIFLLGFIAGNVPKMAVLRV